MQTRKVTSFPIVLLGTSYWGGLVDWMRQAALDHGTVNERDIELLTVTDDVEYAVQVIIEANDGLGDTGHGEPVDTAGRTE